MASDEVSKKLYDATADADRRVAERVGEVAQKRGVPRAQVALAWLLAKPVVTAPIIGASKPGHLEDAVAALSLKLTPEEVAALEEPYIPHPIAGFN
jgi:1-deoxyxylulose-5-phosphate synthase